MFEGCSQLVQIDAPKVTEIKDYAFEGCQSLKNISFPSLKKIGYRAFYGVLSIVDINLPSVSVIQDGAFEECYNLKSVSFESCTIVEKFAFKNCKSLSKIYFPNLEEIADQSFENTGLVKVELNSVSRIAKYLNVNPRNFGGCTKLTHISLKNADIIRNYMFEDCTQLVHIDMPKVTEIQPGGLNKCKNLKSLTIGCQTVDFSRIPNPSMLTEINFPNVVSIPDSALNNLKNLEFCRFPSVTTIKSGTFNNLGKLVELELPKVTELEENAFIGCFNLNSITLKSLTKVDSNSPNIFNGCSNLQKLYLPSIPPKTFNKNTFKSMNCKVIIPIDSIQKYDNDVSIEGDKENDGYWCGLQLQSKSFNVKINKGNVISGSQLSDCVLLSGISETAIISLEIVNGVIIISSFIDEIKKMINLNELIISESVVMGGQFTDGLFSGLNISSISIFSHIEKVSINCFKDCLNLKTVQITNCNNTYDSAFIGCLNLEFVLLNTETLIGDSHFKDCSSLQTISLTHLLKVDPTAENIFSNCPLKSLYLPSEPPSTFHKDTFKGKNVMILGLTDNELMNYDSNIEVEGDVIDDKKWCGIELIQIFIEVSINDNDFVLSDSIANAALLSQVTNINKIKIRRGLINKKMMEEMKNLILLTHLIIEETAFLESFIIDSEQFKDFINLQYVSIMHNITLMKNCFSGCISLVSAEFKSAFILEDSCFKNCISLKTLIIPQCNTLKGNYVFANCSELENLDLSFLISVNSQSENNFMGCTGLKTIKLPSIEPIEFNKNSFKDCHNIKLILPNPEDYIHYDDNSHVKDDIIEDDKWCGINFGQKNYTNLLYFKINNVEYRQRNLKNFIPKQTFANNNFIEIKSLELIEGDFDQYELKSLIGGSSTLEIFVAQQLTLTNLLPSTFVGCFSLKEISIFDDIKIQKNTFSNIPSLINLSLPMIASLHSNEFDGTQNLQEIYLPLLSTVPNGLFANLTKLTKINLTSASILNDGCFKNCNNLTKIYLPSVKTIIGDSHFQGCTKLNSISLPSLEIVDSAGSLIFGNCSHLSNLLLPNLPPSLFNESVFINAGAMPNISLLDKTAWMNYLKQCSIDSENNHYIWYGFDTELVKKNESDHNISKVDGKNKFTVILIVAICCTFVGTSAIYVIIYCIIQKIKYKLVQIENYP